MQRLARCAEVSEQCLNFLCYFSFIRPRFSPPSVWQQAFHPAFECGCSEQLQTPLPSDVVGQHTDTSWFYLTYWHLCCVPCFNCCYWSCPASYRLHALEISFLLRFYCPLAISCEHIFWVPCDMSVTFMDLKLWVKVFSLLTDCHSPAEQTLYCLFLTHFWSYPPCYKTSSETWWALSVITSVLRILPKDGSINIKKQQRDGEQWRMLNWALCCS